MGFAKLKVESKSLFAFLESEMLVPLKIFWMALIKNYDILTDRVLLAGQQEKVQVQIYETRDFNKEQYMWTIASQS